MQDPIIIRTDRNLFLSEISPFKEIGIPVNSILCKGRTAIGATTLAEESKDWVILAVPGNEIIKNKLGITMADEFVAVGNKFPIFGGTGKTIPKRMFALKQFLLADIPNKKIYTTPDSFWYIIECAKDLNILDKLYKDYFLFVDEFHCYAEEAYRKNIINPFEYFWKFERKSFVSATPFYYRDENFDKLQYYIITFPGQTLGKIDLIQTDNVPATLNYILSNSKNLPGNLHVFYNVVKYLGEQLRMVITENPDFDCNIFCSPKKENLVTLNELAKFVNSSPTTDNLKTVNIYTSRHFEGLDLFDKNATVILVTDIRSNSAKVGIGNKGVQAVGRLRDKPHQVIHITNCRNIPERRTLDEIYRQVEFDANTSIKNYNENLKEAQEKELKPKQQYKDEVLKYAVLDEETKTATLHTVKLAQVACDNYYDEDFNNIHFVKKAWKDAYYEVDEKKVMLSALPNISRKNRSQKIRFWCEKFEELDKGIYLNSENETERLKKLGNDHEEINYAHRAYTLLGIKKLVDIGYNVKAIDQEIRLVDSAKGYEKVVDKVLQEIELWHLYSKSEMKTLLQKIYDECNYKNGNGKPVRAKATDLRNIFQSIDELNSSLPNHFVDINSKSVSVSKLR
ncbi:MAG TPA: hypothetical protein VL125_12400 [Pelobium sp.]|nr:hypothetical protein [Pelobium sp.]